MPARSDGVRGHGSGRPARVLLAAIALASLLAARPGLADDTAMGRAADGVYPIDSADVEMAAEEVTIRLPAEGDDAYAAEAICVFTFHNTSAQPVDVLMGFPGEFTPEFLAESMVTWGGVVHDFRAFVDGIEVQVTPETGSLGPEGVRERYASWYTFPVSFAPDQTRTVVNTYRFASTANSLGDVYLGYVLTTGGYWKGSIGRAKVTLELGAVRPWQIENLYPNNWRFTPDAKVLTWERAAFEPSLNLAVHYNVGHWTPGYLDNIDPGTRQFFLDRRAGWEELLGRIPELGQEELRELYRQAVSEVADQAVDWGVGGGPAVRAAYLRSLLPDYEWRPPVITALEAAFGNSPSEVSTVKVDYADPDGDLVRLTVRVGHRGDGGELIVDTEETETSRWTYRSDFEGSLSQGLRFPAVPGCLYTFTAELEDSQGCVTSKSIEVKAPESGPPPQSQTEPQPLPPAEPAPQPTSPTGAGRTAPTLWFGLGAAGMAALAAGALLVRARLRRRTIRQ